MVKEFAFGLALLTCLPANAIAQSACSARVMTACENELYEAGVVWEGRAREERVKFDACTQKLKVRTATVVKTLFVPKLPEDKPVTWWESITVLAGASALGLGVGVALGVFFTR